MSNCQGTHSSNRERTERAARAVWVQGFPALMRFGSPKMQLSYAKRECPFMPSAAHTSSFSAAVWFDGCRRSARLWAAYPAARRGIWGIKWVPHPRHAVICFLSRERKGLLICTARQKSDSENLTSKSFAVLRCHKKQKKRTLQHHKKENPANCRTPKKEFLHTKKRENRIFGDHKKENRPNFPTP